jgi:hypothetical protein
MSSNAFFCFFNRMIDDLGNRCLHTKRRDMVWPKFGTSHMAFEALNTGADFALYCTWSTRTRHDLALVDMLSLTWDSAISV